jgi:UDP-GlcNAc:undecaprenyl-phosphate GlcNAc-1-phosphate transferase
LEFLGQTVDLGVLAVPFTVFWILGSINALNLLDGIDGLAGTIGLVISAAIACVAIISGQSLSALIAVSLVGGCAAFLYANFPPAKMFLGDTGSMLLGLLLGVLVAMSCSNGPGLLSLAPAVGLLTIPIMDSSVALLRRQLTGRSIYATDRGHLHHCLMQALESHHAVLLVAGMACAASGIGAVLSVFQKNDITAIICSTLVVAALVSLRLFGHVEFALLRSKVAMRLSRFGNRQRLKNGSCMPSQVAVRLQGQRQWELLWDSLTACALKLELLRIDLDINSPAIKEGFHANWSRQSDREWHECWRMEIPLFVDGLSVGRLQVAGDQCNDDGFVCDAVDELIELLSTFEKAFVQLAKTHEFRLDTVSEGKERFFTTLNRTDPFGAAEPACGSSHSQAEVVEAHS